MRRALLVTTLAAAAVVPSFAPAGRDASRPPVACPRLLDKVWIDFGEWGGPGTGIARERFALTGSKGANRPGGFMIFGSATPTRATTDRACRRTSVLPNPSRQRLSRPFTYRRTSNGNVYFAASDGRQVPGERLHPGGVDPVISRLAWGITYSCLVGTRVTVLITDSRDRAGRVVGSYFSARVGRELLATAVLREQGESFFRISSRCEQR